eukprot:PhF_6_TR23979/c0_g1_i1/m.33578
MQVERLETSLIESSVDQDALYAILQDDIDKLISLLPNIPDQPILHKIAYLAKDAMLREVLQRCKTGTVAVDVNQPYGPLGATPLHAAAAGLSLPVTTVLVEEGADMGLTTTGSMVPVSAMDVAVWKGCTPIVRFFLSRGLTPLTNHLMAALRNDHHDIAVLLLKHNCKYEVLLGSELNGRLSTALEACGIVVGSKLLAFMAPQYDQRGVGGVNNRGGAGGAPTGKHHPPHRALTNSPTFESAIGKVLQARLQHDHEARMNQIKRVRLKPIEHKYGQWMKVRIHNGLYVIGTLRYTGPVVGYEGTWLGLELHAPLGTHDGMVEGRRYYTTNPNHALMCRAVEATPVTAPTEIKLLQNHNARYYWNLLNQEKIILPHPLGTHANQLPPVKGVPSRSPEPLDDQRRRSARKNHHVSYEN